MTRLATAALVFALALAVVGLHLAAGFTFPHPWPDESHFITPALQLAHHGTLDVPQLNAPEGIFWLPHGYYVLIAPLLWLPLDPLDAARWFSLIGAVVFATCLVLVCWRAGSRLTIAIGLGGAWLLLPRTVVAADMARQEAPVLALAGIAMVLAQRRRWPAAVAIAAAAALVHPVGAVVFVVFAVCAVAAGLRSWQAPRIDVVVVAIVVLAVVAQAVYFLVHWDLTVAHLGFQLTRKAGREISVDAVRLVLAAGAVAGLWLRRRDPTARVLFALALGMIVVAVVGREMWYEFLGTETAVLLLFAGLVPLLGEHLAVRVLALIALAAIAVGGFVATLRVPVFGMRAATADRAEWHAFTDTLIRDVTVLDAAARTPQTVLLDPLSGAGQVVFNHEWRQLRFVQPTPVTPLDSSDLVMITPGAPFAGLDEPVQPLLTKSSPNGVFRAVIGPPG